MVAHSFRLGLSKKQKLPKNPEYGVFLRCKEAQNDIPNRLLGKKCQNTTVFWFPVCFTLISYRCQSYSSRTNSADTLVPNNRVGSDIL